MDYLIGTYYQCAKCLYCKEDSLKSLCECDKNITPTTRNHTKLVPYAFTIHYNTKFNDKQIKVLTDSKEKYYYDMEFTEDFKFSFCSACNSKWYRIGKTKPTRSKVIKSTNSKLIKSKSPTERTTFDNNNHITNISEIDKLDDHITFINNNDNHITNISETDQLDDYTTFNTNKYITNISEIGEHHDHIAFDYDTSVSVCDEFEDLLNKEVEEPDLENDNFNRQLDELDNRNNKYENKKFLFKLYIKNQDNTTLPAK
ncbi:1376_t:CDS:1 [Cetraspora pellucida]|uniref:1376_t:CDS:1 n=1 Tax=Cetraspora pellucida TaxID=1433469 RepID=A0A9N9IEI0_9GLOM|nr:1376_t:CDS:1 [Cetraspora pellucida]